MKVAGNTLPATRAEGIRAVAAANTAAVAVTARARVAVLSDIHGNLTAFEAVMADIRQTSPDLVLHGGDLCDGGSSPVEILDRIRGLGWQGVIGNTDEMLVRPDSLEAFASQSAAPATLWTALRQVALATRDLLGNESLNWLAGLPQMHSEAAFSIVHATPQSCWRAPSANATDAELNSIYSSVSTRMVVFGHTHLPFIRRTAGQMELLINSGSVGLPFDGDPRASYLLLDGAQPQIRRVEYDLEKELKALFSSGLPGAAWTASMLRTSSPQLP
jgi:predicted phosphodiesterase